MMRTPRSIRLTLLFAMLWFVVGCASPLREARPSFRRSTAPTTLPSSGVTPRTARTPALPPPSSVTSRSLPESDNGGGVVRNQSPQVDAYQQGLNAWGTQAPVYPQGGPAATAPYSPTYPPPVGNAPGPYSQQVFQGGPPAATAPFPQAGIPLGQPVAQPGMARPFYVSPDGPFDPAIGPLADIFVNVQETQTGKFSLGASVNSDAGVTGQIVVDERNFDIRRIPTSFDDFLNGSAFRGAGQGFRLEALPGNDVQRYMLQFTEPYLFNTRVSFNLSAYLFDRNFFDWDEQRLGGRVSLGYRITPDLSLAASIRAEEVTISDPRVLGVPELDAAIGSSNLFSSRISLIQDTRDITFQPTQGYYLGLSFEQVFGSFDYSRGEIDFRRYFLLSERPDGSGRHVLGFSNRVGFSGSQTPIFENYFAGGYSTLRGFDFRGASPQDGGVTVGGEFQMLGSAEYLFPITADDMLKGVAFVDYGTVEEKIELNADDYRVSVGMGLRIFVPAMGPAPIALDFAVPLARENTDDIRQFSFFIGVSR